MIPRPSSKPSDSNKVNRSHIALLGGVVTAFCVAFALMSCDPGSDSRTADSEPRPVAKRPSVVKQKPIGAAPDATRRARRMEEGLETPGSDVGDAPAAQASKPAPATAPTASQPSAAKRTAASREDAPSAPVRRNPGATRTAASGEAVPAVVHTAARAEATASGTSGASSDVPSPAPVGAGPTHTAPRKLARGLAGVGLGVLELPGSVVEETRSEGVLSGMTVGVAKGVLRLVPRHVVGLFELLTAPIAYPDNYAPILDPEFTWEYFQRERTPTGGIVLQLPFEFHFAFDSTALTDAAREEVGILAKILAARPELRIALRGFTDSSGDPVVNQQLSTERAVAVKEELVLAGVAAEQIYVLGMGAADPIASNDTRAGRRSNRRVEVSLVREV